MERKESSHELKQVQIRLKVSEGPSLYSSKPMNSPEAAVEVMADMMSQLDREYVCIVNLDNKNRPINFNIVSIGAINEAMAPIQNIFKAAILSNAASIILLHNHVSGAAIEPSEEDINITKKVIRAGKLLEIPVLDHIIVGGYYGETYSLREEQYGLFRFREKSGTYGVKESNPQEWRKRREEQMQKLMEDLEEGVKSVFESDNYKAFLDTMASFHKYSYRNSLLIAMQSAHLPEGKATYVAGYKAWQTKFHRQVKKGEKAIQIIAPMQYKQTLDQDKRDPDTNQPVRNPDGSIQKEKVTVIRTGYKVESVFDISQTYGEPLPSIYKNIEGDVTNYEQFLAAIYEVSPVPIVLEPMKGREGYYSLLEKKIHIRDDLSQRQTVAAMIHEMSHATLHDLDMTRPVESAKERNKDARTMEVEADSIAYVVNSFFGIDTGENNFGYIAGWSKDKDLQELHASLQTIRDTARDFIDHLENELVRMRKVELQKDEFLNNQEDRFAIYHLTEDDKDIQYRMKNTKYMERNGMEVRPGDYRQIYVSPLQKSTSLDDIYDTCPIDLSISDIIAMRRDGQEHAFYVDNFGFKELPTFIPYLRSTEVKEIMEQGKTLPIEEISTTIEGWGNIPKIKQPTEEKMISRQANATNIVRKI